MLREFARVVFPMRRLSLVAVILAGCHSPEYEIYHEQQEQFARIVDAMRTQPNFVRVTNAGVRESHVHDVQITKEAPNYRLD